MALNDLKGSALEGVITEAIKYTKCEVLLTQSEKTVPFGKTRDHLRNNQVFDLVIGINLFFTRG